MTGQGFACVVEAGRPATVTAPAGTDPVTWLTGHLGDVRAALDAHGALYIRGLGVDSAEAFARARDVLIAEPVAYREKATPRSDFGNGVFSSTDMPASHPIRLHNENSYTLVFPGLLLFGCLVAPDEGGATTVADCREILSAIPADIVEDFRVRGWSLRRAYQDRLSLSWQVAFDTDRPELAEAYCQENRIAYRWASGGLVTSQVRPATIRHPGTGDEVWFNHVAFWNRHSLDPDVREVLIASLGEDGLPFDTRYGDGAPIPPDVVGALNNAYARALRRRTWQVGDLLLVDNILACHGREPYRGDRKIVVAMGQRVRMADCRPSVAPAPGAVAVA